MRKMTETLGATACAVSTPSRRRRALPADDALTSAPAAVKMYPDTLFHVRREAGFRADFGRGGTQPWEA